MVGTAHLGPPGVASVARHARPCADQPRAPHPQLFRRALRTATVARRRVAGAPASPARGVGRGLGPAPWSRGPVGSTRLLVVVAAAGEFGVDEAQAGVCRLETERVDRRRAWLLVHALALEYLDGLREDRALGVEQWPGVEAGSLGEHELQQQPRSKVAHVWYRFGEPSPQFAPPDGRRTQDGAWPSSRALLDGGRFDECGVDHQPERSIDDGSSDRPHSPDLALRCHRANERPAVGVLFAEQPEDRPDVE